MGLMHIADDVKTNVEARCLSAHHLDCGCALDDFRRLLPLRFDSPPFHPHQRNCTLYATPLRSFVGDAYMQDAR